MKHINHRYNPLRDRTCQLLNTIGGTARIECAFAVNGSHKRADGDWIIEGKRILWDNAIVDPLSPSHIDQHFGMPKTANDSEKRKRANYQSLASQIHADFIPLIVGTTGGFGVDLKEFITRLRAIAKRKVIMNNNHEIIKKYQGDMACLLARHNSWIIQYAVSKANHTLRNYF